MFMRVSLVLLALTTLPAWGTTTFYVGSSGETQFGFDLTARGLIAGSLLDFTGTSSGTTISNVAGTGVNFSSAAGLASDPSGYISLSSTSSGTAMQIAAPSTVYALGLYLAGGGPTLKNWTYGPSGGTVSLSNASTIFLGVISDLPLASLPTITLTSPSGTAVLVVNDFKIGTLAPPSGGGAETPEPSTFALIGSGLILFPAIARRRSRNRQASER